MSMRILLLPFVAALCLSNAVFAESAVKVYKSHAIAIHGQPKYDSTATHYDYVNPNATKGGVFRKSVNGTFDSLNPLIEKGNPATGTGLVYETLMAQSDDEPFTMYGLIAQTIEWPADKSWVTFHINPNAKFHDGHPITAEDVVFSFNILTEHSVLYKSYFSDVEKVESINHLSAKFTLKPTENPELIAALGQLSILPKHFWQDKDFNKANLDIPLGSGPYEISSLNAGKNITYSKVKNHWAKDHFSNVGMYNFNKIIYEYYRDRNVTFEAFKANEFDVRYEATAKTWATGYDFPAIKSKKVKRMEIRDGNPKGMTAIFINQRREKFHNINLRKAMDYAFDFEWTKINIFHNSYERTKSYFTNSDFASSGPLTGRELEILAPFKKQLPKSVFNSYYEPPKTSGKGKNRNNLRKAKKLLEASNYKVVANELIDPQTNQPVAFEFLMYDASMLRIYNPYFKNLEKLGIKVTPVIVDQSQYINRLNTFNYDLTHLSALQSLSPGNEQVDYWHSSSADQNGSRNYLGIKNKVIDQLIAGIISAPTRDELIYQTRALDRVLLSYHYVVPLYHANSHRIAYWDKFQQPNIPPKYDFRYGIGFLTWWIDEDKEKALIDNKK